MEHFAYTATGHHEKCSPHHQQEVIRMVNKLAYILLALFLGSFGIHKFYAGKPIQGLLHIAFCWTAIPQILAVLSALRVLLKESDEYGRVAV